MMRGDIVDGIDPKDLNTIIEFDLESFKKDSDWEPYYDYVGRDLYSSEYFRRQCIEAGYYITSLYPVYHQGWELDEWGALGTKDGKYYILETDHGSLRPVETEAPTAFNFFKTLARIVFRVK